MSTLSIRLPESLHKNLKKISKKEKISLNQFITNAVTEKITAVETEIYLKERANNGNKKNYIDVLEKVKDIEPDELDR
ncbi:MAG: CopG family transcriptional regulator [Spirochaetes bacterium GWD1_27_9]|nr:MAG: CopG family transcriptional regulator [Spirochaetes bacterium GWB1_27_13]OHD20669.1 MAG: CopG family transcriptional regulator [Spirochaetes bacterium GWC1_27_15]OHD44674.1 MAG: CopG family transcriptional regulator [Spirochaetes bacterium GWD1_27_9]